MKTLLMIWIGGGLGSVCRYLVQLGIGRVIKIPFPAGTLLVNITGCFIIGILYSLIYKHNLFTQEWRMFLITGLCGGFTTFSSFSHESVSLLKQGNYTYFALYLLLSVVAGLLATLGGFAIVK